MPPDELLERISVTDRWDGSRWVPGNRSDLLTGNMKMDKSKNLPPNRQAKLSKLSARAKGVLVRGLSLSPDVESGIEMCARSTNCAQTCLAHSSGRTAGEEKQRVRIKKTLFWWLFPDDFHEQLVAELGLLQFAALREHYLPAARLNVGSDIPWEMVPEIRATPVVKYAYTKLPWEMRQGRPSNWHVLYSLSEARGSLEEAFRWLQHGGNAAVVVGPSFSKKEEGQLKELNKQLAELEATGADRSSRVWVRALTARSKLLSPGKHNERAKEAAQRLLERGELWGHPVIDGDTDDARFLDDPGAWVVLATKGPAFYDTTGFVVRLDSETGLPIETPEQHQRREVSLRTLKASKAAFRNRISPVLRMQEAEDYARTVGEPIPGAKSKRTGQADLRPSGSFCFNVPMPWQMDPWGRRLW